jgi:hypothetical protein
VAVLSDELHRYLGELRLAHLANDEQLQQRDRGPGHRAERAVVDLVVALSGVWLTKYASIVP